MHSQSFQSSSPCPPRATLGEMSEIAHVIMENVGSLSKGSSGDRGRKRPPVSELKDKMGVDVTTYFLVWHITVVIGPGLGGGTGETLGVVLFLESVGHPGGVAGQCPPKGSTCFPSWSGRAGRPAAHGELSRGTGSQSSSCITGGSTKEVTDLEGLPVQAGWPGQTTPLKVPGGHPFPMIFPGL